MSYLFDQIRQSMPAAGRPAIETADGCHLSYGDIVAQSAAWARALVALGVRPGDRVAVQVEKSVAALLLYLGSLRAGAVFLPLNPAYTTSEVGYFIADAEPRLLVVDPGRAAAAAALPCPVATLDADGRGSLADLAQAAAGGFADIPRGPDELAAILYTSGTTGRAKGAMLSHGNLAANARTLVDLWRFTAGDVLLHALPVFHVHGLFIACHVALLAGARLLWLPRFDPAAILRLMPRATTLMGVPTFYTRLLDQPGLAAAAAGMRLFISGSAPLLADSHRAFAAATGHQILERYGMTETGMITSNPYDGPRRPGWVGPALPDVVLRVSDPETGRPVPPGQTGMVELRGPNVFKGYWRQPDKTAEAFRPDGFFITGDLGRCDDTGCLQIVGRARDLIISGGLNIYPKEVEEAIDALPGVLESAVIGLPDPDLGEQVAAVVVPRPGATLDPATLLAGLHDRLARFKQPRRIVIADRLPRNTMGKVQKAVLRAAWGKVADYSDV